MAIRTVLAEEIAEGTTPVLTATFKDEDGNVVTTLTAATLTLYAERSKTIINGRDRTDILAGGLNIVSAGVVTWPMAAADTATVDSAYASEVHVALFEWSWSGGDKVGKHEIAMRVKNFALVPAA